MNLIKPRKKGIGTSWHQITHPPSVITSCSLLPSNMPTLENTSDKEGDIDSPSEAFILRE